MKNILLDTAENLYAAMGREAAIAFMYRNWKLTSSDKALNDIVDFINYVADMEESEGLNHVDAVNLSIGV